MADIISNVFLQDLSEKKINFNTDVLKCAFFVGAFNAETLRDVVSYNDITVNEATQQYGYITGGLSVTGNVVTLDTVLNELIYDIDDIIYDNNGGTFDTIRYGVLYNTSNSNRCIYVFDFGGDKVIGDGSKFRILIDANGLIRVKQA
jgi:hypothetical protein